MVGSGILTETIKSRAIAVNGDRPYHLSRLAVVLALLTLSACAPSLPRQPDAAFLPDAPNPVAAPVASEPEPTPAPMPAAARLLVLDQIAGMRSEDLAAVLGPPDFRRSEPPAELWQYRSADCVLDIFLYRDGGDYRVAQSAVRNRHLLAGLEPCTASGALDGRDRRS